MLCGCRKEEKERWKPTVFQECLLDNNIELINTRPYHPKTNGKIERLFRTIEEELYNYKSMEEYIEYYNNERLHFSLDIEYRYRDQHLRQRLLLI